MLKPTKLTLAIAMVTLLTTAGSALASPHVWHDLDKAQAEAARSGKPLLVEIGAKW